MILTRWQTRIARFSARRPTLVVAIAFGLLIIALYAPVVFLGKTLLPPLYYSYGSVQPRETTSASKAPPETLYNLELSTAAYYEFPLNYEIGESYRNFTLPLWNPYQAAGMPLAAQYSSRAFFPYQILEDVLPSQTWDFFLLGRIWIAGFFTYLFLISLGLRRKTAFLGGALYMFSGSFTWFLNLEQMSNVAMVLPILMYCLDKALKGSNLYWGLSPLVVALLLLAGQPETAVYALLLATVFVLCRIWILRAQGTGWWHSIFYYAVMVVAGTALAAPLLLSFWELSTQALNIHPAGGTMGTTGIPPGFWSTGIVLPTFFTYPTWERTLPINGVWDFLGGYTGLLPWILLLAGVFAGRGHRRLLFLFGGYGLFILLKNFGIPPFLWLGHLPIFDQVWSQRWAGPTWTFAIAAGAGIGLESILQKIEGSVMANTGSVLTTAEEVGGKAPPPKNITARLSSFLVIGIMLVIAGLSLSLLSTRIKAETPLLRHLLTAAQILLVGAGLGSGIKAAFRNLPGQPRPFAWQWWAPATALLAAAILATNYPALIVDTHPLSRQFASDIGNPLLIPSVYGGVLVALLTLFLTAWVIGRARNSEVVITLLLIALAELWFAMPRGYAMPVALIQIIPALLVLVAALWLERKTWRWAASALAGAFVLSLVLGAVSPQGMPPRTNPYRPAPYVEFLKNKKDYSRIMAIDGILFPNLASTVGLYDVRYIVALDLPDYHFYSSQMRGQEASYDDSSTLWFTGSPEMIPQLKRYGYQIVHIPQREAIQRQMDYYSLLGVRYFIVPKQKEFIYSDQFGNNDLYGTPAWTSGRSMMPPDAYASDSLKHGNWGYLDGHLRLFSRDPEDLIYKFEFDDDITSATLYSQIRISPGGGSIKVSISQDGEYWQGPIVSVNKPSLYRDRVQLPESVRGGHTLFLKFTGWSPAGDDSTALLGWSLSVRLADGPPGGQATISGKLTSRLAYDLPLPLVYDGEVRIYENREALPRAFLVSDIQYVRSQLEAWQKIRSTEIDIGKTALLEQNLPEPFPAKLAPPESDVRIEKYKSDHIVLRTSSQQPAMLVLTDAWAQGWQATVDGKKSAIFRVDGVVRGVYVPAGSHEIVFHYVPRGFILGVIISLIAALGLLTWALKLWRKGAITTRLSTRDLTSPEEGRRP